MRQEVGWTCQSSLTWEKRLIELIEYLRHLVLLKLEAKVASEVFKMA